MKDKTYERDINLYQEEKIYCVDGSELGQKNYEKIRYAIGENNAVGSVSGYHGQIKQRDGEMDVVFARMK